MQKTNFRRILKKHFLIWAALGINTLVIAQVHIFPLTDVAISFQGRTVLDRNGNIELISSASFVGFSFEGDSCSVLLRNIASPGEYNYVALEIDDEYAGRLKVSGTEIQNPLIKPLRKRSWHTLRMYKATEAANGVVAFYGVTASRLRPLPTKKALKIEFIGNSITCGMGNDVKEIPCNAGSKWYDQHNAYWSYASITARAIGADFMLSSISGAGIYRNWNSDGPTVPQQYKSAYLRIDSLRQWDFKSFIPDIVAIALGTNDLSKGDGILPRLPFDSTSFIREYIKFIGTIYTNYPAAKIILLTSPMISDERAQVLYMCLKKIKTKAAQQYPDRKEIGIYRFSAVPSTGCSGHPTIDEHKMMASQLIPFLRNMINK
jgi:lysophospholipase L1-like esterase